MVSKLIWPKETRVVPPSFAGSSIKPINKNDTVDKKGLLARSGFTCDELILGRDDLLDAAICFAI